MLYSFADGIHAVDSEYGRPRLAAVHLIVDQGRAAVVDTAHAGAAPRVLEALDRLGIARQAVDYILLTHIHLDHAGGAGTLLNALPAARVVVHPRGARHMIDPSKLWAGTVEVYGEAKARALYGELVPVPAERVVEAADGLALELGTRRIEVLDTPGHARHHVCYYDERARAWFTGDTFGLSYRELDVDGRPSVWPTTTPVQFDPGALHGSIDRLMAREPQAMYLTHFSRVGEVTRLAADLHRLIDGHRQAAESARGLPSGERVARIRDELEALLLDEAARQRWTLSRAALLELMAIDLQLNAQGLAVWLDTPDRAGGS